MRNQDTDTLRIAGQLAGSDNEALCMPRIGSALAPERGALAGNELPPSIHHFADLAPASGEPIFDRHTRERFWRFVRWTPGCWLWTGSTTGALNHGQFHIGRLGKQLLNGYAHRVAWRLLRGPIPDGLQLNHRCDVPTCVNPDHVYLGTQGDNMREAKERGRLPKTRRHRKMSDAQVRECLSLREQGWTLLALADRFNVTKGYISMVCRGLRRAHVDHDSSSLRRSA